MKEMCGKSVEGKRVLNFGVDFFEKRIFSRSKMPMIWRSVSGLRVMRLVWDGAKRAGVALVLVGL
jgi:hypothetical protein